MPAITVKCPICGCDTIIETDNDAEICSACGRPFIVKDAIVNTYVFGGHQTVSSNNSKDFVIRAGKLERYEGESLDVIVPDNVVEIGYAAFSNLPVASVKLPKNLKVIHDSAFSECSSLSSITIPDSVTEIDEACFRGCSSLKTIIIPESVKSLGNYVFERCTGLESVTIKGHITEIGEKAFQNCSSLKTVNLPKTLKKIGDCLFENCCSLKSISIPDSVTEIGVLAFYGCSSLKSVVIPDSVTTIGSRAFENCPLTSLTIPESVKYVGRFAFTYYWENNGYCPICGCKPKKESLFSNVYVCRTDNISRFIEKDGKYIRDN